MGLSTAQPLPDLNDWYSFDLSADLWSKKSSLPIQNTRCNGAQYIR
ncbi:MAG: hypothetical protein IPJ09_17610 [Saprospiraceae bacterium]|nr:hypothetical protein [Saprospiraceae bacterium]